MRKLITFVICIFAFSFVSSCTAEPPTLQNKEEEKETAVTCLNRYFSLNSIGTIGNVVMLHITNTSRETISTYSPDFLELRPIRRGKPKAVNSKFTVYKVDGGKLKRLEVDYAGNLMDEGAFGFDIYPGDSVVISQTMPSPFTKCDDYAIVLNFASGLCDYYYPNYIQLSMIAICKEQLFSIPSQV